MLKTPKLSYGPLMLLLLSALPVFADELPDRIKLRSGAELRVKIMSTPQTEKRSYVVFKTESGATVKLERKRIASLLKSDEANEAYLRHLGTRQETVAWHLEIIEWCKDQPQGRLKFRDEIRYHREMILRIDPDDLKARKLLGYQRVGSGQWMLEDLLYDRYGYERNGATITPKLFRRIDQGDQQANVLNAVFKKQFKLWLRDVKRGRVANQQLQQRLFQLCTESTAYLIFEQHARQETRPNVRAMYIDAFGRVPSRAATGALVYFSVNDPIDELREQAATLLQQPDFDQGLAMTRMSEFMSNPNNRVINEAAFAIKELAQPGDNSFLRDVMLRLTDALVTTHIVPKAGAIEEGRLDVNFGGIGPDSFTTGGGPQTEQVQMRNGSVLSTLKKMTGKDFGYNKKRWEQFFVENYSLADATVRAD